ncbi:MAG: hypothetical protein V1720_10515 [bacterium]
MSLLPIIYTSVAIFAALMIIIISISYITYKVKVDETSFPKAEPAAQPKLAIPILRSHSSSHSQKIVTGKNVNNTVYPIAKNPVKNSPPVLSKQMAYQESLEHSRKSINAKHQIRDERKNHNELKEKSNFSERVKKEKKVHSNKPRLEVVRILSTEKRVDQKKKPELKKELSKSKTDLSNLNFFNFYSDIEGGDLNQIQTSSI